jgi:G3E family GTPase
LFGLDSKQFLEVPGNDAKDENHHSEVETMTLRRGTTGVSPRNHAHEHKHDHVHQRESAESAAKLPLLTSELLADALGTMPKDSIYRVKGFVSFQSTLDASPSDEVFVLNWAFGRFELVPLTTSPRNTAIARMGPGELLLTVMGAAGEVRRYGIKLGQRLGARTV